MDEILNQLELDTTYLKKPTMGYSDDTVYLIKHGYQGKDIVVKYSKRPEVLKEAIIFKWLKDKIKVPEIYASGSINETNYIIMEMLPGRMGQYGFYEMTSDEMIILYANEIKKWHNIEYKDFPNINTLNDKLKHVQYNLEHHLVKTQYFEREFKGMKPEQLYTMMMDLYPQSFDLVLCHGDVCMPNFMIDQGRVTGWIDVVGCGVNDRYLDIAIALRTLRYNFEWLNKTLEDQDIKLFLDTYGITKLDEDKVKFYILLDEMTNG